MYEYLNSSFIARAVTKAVRMADGGADTVLALYHNPSFSAFCEGSSDSEYLADVMDSDALADRIADILGVEHRDVSVDECTDDVLYKTILLEYYRRLYGLDCGAVSDLFAGHDVFKMVDDFIYTLYGGECTNNAIICIAECVGADTT